MTLIDAAKTLAVGVGFGFVLEKCKVYLPTVITNQLLMSDFTMMQMFLTATAGGIIVMSALEHAGLFKRPPKTSLTVGLGTLNGFGGNVLGGAIMGTGMALSGACPGTVIVQLGAGLQSARYVAAGGLVAAVLFGYTHRFIQNFLPKFGSKTQVATVDQRLKVPYGLFGIGAASALLAAVYVLGQVTDSRSAVLAIFKDAPARFSSLLTLRGFDHPTLQSFAWTPVVGGLALTAVQAGSILLRDAPLGASTAYAEIGAQIVSRVDANWKKNAPLYQSHIELDSTYLAVGVLTGSALSLWLAGASELPPLLPAAVSPIQAIVGGFLLVTGARLANGCTSGHGISGMAQFSVPSFATIASMFAGGIATAFLVY
ncbi:uncharacterized protein BJ171DRAFT_455932 [Polychytrium aggregatum]|uniref:uncharacterized protein n=1 Tax=Polychytrium aggregatum TaxID=110093 RepID=UPI0022FEB0FC|nr:uncharacterized protein BJ171DRAFT_455932 [Polychytrium aggregatum]KAI9207959.1 hypothetical protein BJ171DRAFT_455932 [Polychytrium aggregatum]